ncbi:hypothetical protein AWJ20_2385 [Sugiyamaella lignohabitans]|uniref:DUF1776-domain-containing protein n=1 Tax=Sugiyamaella lignohabitans TaxID=796027 RepID=A0A167F3E5_9ASCO|nr:uncharacterized protein AWJ20_2385 [Sugiyamaella lignohabitans]ANB14778.1 hypothetical protein AWJ20_2385 [Sugiyamaella lignohabitans]
MTSHDPVTIIMDKVQEWKGDAQSLISTSVEAISESSAYKSLEKVLARTRDSTIAALPSSRVTVVTPPPPTQTLTSKCSDWISSHKLLAGAVALGLTGGSAYYMYNSGLYDYLINGPSSGSVYTSSFLSSHGRRAGKRRAKRAANNGRKEVVILAGSPAEPITRAIAADLNKRGFIIYWTTSSPEEEAFVQRENSPDIRKLPINVSDASSIEASMQALDHILSSPVVAFQGATPHELELAGVVVVPDLYYPCGPIESVRVDTWSDLMYSKLLGPIFLLSNGLIDLVRRHKSRILILSPSIMSTLSPAFHAPESIAASSIESLALCLHRELAGQGIPVVHLKLGSFDISHGRPQERQIANSVRADILSWSQRVRSLYSQQYQASAYLQTTRAYGSNLRVLHYSVFDALTTAHPRRVWYVGKGSYAYHFLTRWLPESAMSWLLQPPTASLRAASPEPEKGWETV